MRISLVTQFFPPETFAGANRVKAIADALAPIGSLVVAAPWPSYPDRAAYRDFRETPASDAVTVRRIAPFTAQRRGWAARATYESLMAGRLAFTAGRGGADVFVASSPSMFLGPATLAAARARSARFVWDIRDLTWEYGKEDGVVASRAARAALAAVSRLMWRTARASDVVVCATEGLANVVSDRVPSQRVELIQNGVDSALLERFDHTPPSANERTRVLYAGLVGHAQALEVLLDVAQLAPQLEIIVAGDGPHRAGLVSEARKRGLTNLTFTGYVGLDRLVELYHTSDILFAQLRSSDLHSRTAAPSKLLEYMAAGRPIVYAGAGLAADLIRRSGGGRVVSACDAAAIAGEFESMTEGDRLLLGRCARRFVEGLPTRLDEMRRLASIVQDLA
jgi:glycosyltransferase involved in cell wall biosynthesis